MYFSHVIMSTDIIIKQESLDFGDISIVANAVLSEIDDYLRHPVQNVKDPLKWWFANRALYPNLSRMGLDYLSIPGKFVIVNTISIIKYFSFSYVDRCRASVLPRPSTFTFHKESSVAGIHPRLPLSGIVGSP